MKTLKLTSLLIALITCTLFVWGTGLADLNIHSKKSDRIIPETSLPVLQTRSTENPVNVRPDKFTHSAGSVQPAASGDWPFPCSQDSIRKYTAYHVTSSPKIDGRLDEDIWEQAPRSPRFVDLISGGETIHDTRAAVLWDDDNMYVAFWHEEPFTFGTMTERNAPLYNENNAEVFIAGKDAYYEFEINALGTHYEAFFIWEEAYERGGFGSNPAFQRSNSLVRPFNGVGFKSHPRGPRIGSWDFYFPGLQSGVFIDGTLNDNSDRDRGWTVELAFPWNGMEWLAKADQRALPPTHNDIWRIDFSRFNPYKEAPPANDSGGWTWSSHGIWDSHIPECFPIITFSRKPL